MALVQLGRLLVDESRLELEQAGTGDAALLAAVRQCEQDGGFGERFNASGWRVLAAEDDEAAVGAWSDSWSGWVLLDLRLEKGTWEVHGSSYGVLPRPTPAERGAGLRLCWPQEPIHVRRGHDWRVEVELVNDRDEPVELDGDNMAFGHLTQTGKELPTEPLFFAGVGLEVRLKPGRSITLPVALFTARLNKLPAGDYELHAHYDDLGLVAPVAVLIVR
jgi:hypothetical protein